MDWGNGALTQLVTHPASVLFSEQITPKIPAICTESAPAAPRATAKKARASARFFGRGAAGRGRAFGADCLHFQYFYEISKRKRGNFR